MLIKDLVYECYSNGLDLEDSIGQWISGFDFDDLYDLFFDLDREHNLYPQIYIPNFDSLSFIVGDPVAIIFNGDESQGDNFTAYVSGATSILTLDSIDTIDESFVSSDEAWVFSLNESVLDDGSVPTVAIPPDDWPDAPYDTVETRNLVNLYCNEITVKDHKESWVAGASEVHIRAALEYYDGLDPNTGLPNSFLSIHFTNDFQGNRVIKVKRKAVKKETTFDIDFLMERAWEDDDFYDDPIIHSFVFFEKDNWPAKVRQASYHPAEGTERSLKYRSAHSHYVSETLFNNIDPLYTSTYYPSGIPSSVHGDNFDFTDSAIEMDTYITN